MRSPVDLQFTILDAAVDDYETLQTIFDYVVKNATHDKPTNSDFEDSVRACVDSGFVAGRKSLTSASSCGPHHNAHPRSE